MQGYTKYIFLFLLLTFSLIASSTINYNENIKKAHSFLLNYELNKASSILDKEKQTDPSNIYIAYLNSYKLFLKSYFNATTKSYTEFDKASSKCLDLIDDEINNDELLGLSAMVYIQRAYIYFLWSEPFSYASALAKGQKRIDAINPHTKNIEYLKIRSIYEVIGGSVPNKFKTYAKWFGIKGSPQKGIQLINIYLTKVEQNSPNKTEGEIVNLYLKNFLDLKSPQIKNKNSVIATYVFLQTCSELASIKISRINQLKKESLPSYYTFLEAKYKLELQDESGLLLMDKFINSNKGLSLVQSAHFYKYWYYCANRNITKQKEELSLIKNSGEPLFPFDKKVLSRIEHLCNPDLIKSRMLFDAGDYNKALHILKNKNIKESLITPNQKIEYLYRMARIYEKTNKYNQAINLYQKVINTNKPELYFVSYSSYRLGRIYEELNNLNQAKLAYKKALDLNQGEYKISIEKKCQFALDMLKIGK